ncbi:MAG: ATP-binding protein [Myxococcota bacterium]
MEILGLYSSPETLNTALAAGARHLAATLQGFALIYRTESRPSEPDGWAGFTCAGDAEAAGAVLAEFTAQARLADRPLRTEAPEEPSRIWLRAAGGVFGFPLSQNGRPGGVAILGYPAEWPRIRNAEVESILRQIALILDHHQIAQSPEAGDPSEEMLRLSEQLFAQDLEIIKQEERLGQVEQLKSDLIEKMSWELRSPLNSIIERVISVLANEHENLSESGREWLRAALDDGNALLRTLQNILDLWRVKQNELRLELQETNLAEVVEEAIFYVRDSLRPEVSFSRKVSSQLPKVRTDLAKLNQILFHLLDNAAKFTPRGEIELEVRLEEGQLLCAVTDTGIGIAPDDQSEIFDEFFLVDNSADSKHRGAGLGLTLAKALVESLGGAISFTSEIGRGSCFSFTLPVTVL